METTIDAGGVIDDLAVQAFHMDCGGGRAGGRIASGAAASRHGCFHFVGHYSRCSLVLELPVAGH